MAKIFLIASIPAALLIFRFAEAADFSINVPGRAAGAGPSVPQQAAAQRFWTLAFDGDMTKGFDVSCNNPATEDHQWYLGGWGVMWGSCRNLNYPHTDETDGSKVLDINLGPSSQNGAILGRVGISTSDDRGAHNHNFPINAYYECTVRMDSYSIGHMPLWHNCWMVDVNWGITAGASGNAMEYELEEFHGGYFQAEVVGSHINWPCGGGGNCSPVTWGGNIANVIPGYDPSKFHKYGMLIYQVDADNIHVAGYVDDVLIHEGVAPLGNYPQNKKQRNYLVVDLTGGCNWDEGSISECTNIAVQKVFADGNGNTHVQIEHPPYMSGNFLLNIQGVAGVTSPINGDFGFTADNWGWWLPGLPCIDANNKPGAPCTITLLNAPFGQPIRFSGNYTGGGIVNRWVDSGMHVYVKSFRVWSCDTWATNECSKFNYN